MMASGRRKLDDETIDRLRALWDKGYTAREICEELLGKDLKEHDIYNYVPARVRRKPK